MEESVPLVIASAATTASEPSSDRTFRTAAEADFGSGRLTEGCGPFDEASFFSAIFGSLCKFKQAGMR